MHNTGTTARQTKAFNIAEAGVDMGQRTLWQAWPMAEAAAPVLDNTAFRTVFASADFPEPRTGDFIDVAFYDDDGTPLPNPGINRGVNWDANGNDIMWIESRGATVDRAARIMACVQRVQYDLRIREGVAIFTTGDLVVKGTGSQPVVGLDPPASEASVYANGTISMNGNSDAEAGIHLEANSSTSLQDVFPTEIVQNIIQAGKVFANWSAYEAWKAAHPGPDPFASDPRIIVIENGDVDTKDIPDTDVVNGNDTVWTEENPGILVVLNGNLKDTGQKKIMYGIVYVVNGIVLGGNAEIHGMVVAEQYGTLNGTRAVNYNGNVIANLNRPVTLSVKLVPNTWRELQP
jgi:hypothetical protein